MTDQNKKLVRDFYELAFNQHKPREAVQKYVGDRYIQHNPFVPSGAEPFYVHFEGYFKEHPKSHVVFSHVIAARLLLQADVERIVVHAVTSEAAKPFARAEVITTGKGLLDRVAFVVAGARNHLQANRLVEFRVEVALSPQGAVTRSSSPTSRASGGRNRRCLRRGLMSPTIYDPITISPDQRSPPGSPHAILPSEAGHAKPGAGSSSGTSWRPR